MPKVSGEFSVRIAPESMSSVANESGISRMSLDKQYRGAVGQWPRRDAGIYEPRYRFGRVCGDGAGAGHADGLHGSFLLHHCGTMQRGTSGLTVAVVPDSGQDELAGLSGRCKSASKRASITTISIISSVLQHDLSSGCAHADEKIPPSAGFF
jgi:hypothetical protein